jgi:hypothetical protein
MPQRHPDCAILANVEQYRAFPGGAHLNRPILVLSFTVFLVSYLAFCFHLQYNAPGLTLDQPPLTGLTARNAAIGLPDCRDNRGR